MVSYLTRYNVFYNVKCYDIVQHKKSMGAVDEVARDTAFVYDLQANERISKKEQVHCDGARKYTGTRTCYVSCCVDKGWLLIY